MNKNFNSGLMKRALLSAALVATISAAHAGSLAAMPADTVKACYVNGSGSLYRIGAVSAPSTCTQSKHVLMKWPDGNGDDYARYMLVDGVRHGGKGFAVTGKYKGGIPIILVGAGTRMMWLPTKAAFRAGRVSGDQWNPSNIGDHSVAMGEDTKASGFASMAFGSQAVAERLGTIAMGVLAKSTADQAVAIGYANKATGGGALALGTHTTASGDVSTAMGHYANTNDKKGAFVYADATNNPVLYAKADNQFVVRAQHFWFGKNSEVSYGSNVFMQTSTGAYLSSGGVWANSSDVNRKHGFEPVDAEQVLEKVTALPISSWSYKDDDTAVRHIGPTAQDFHAAFKLGDTDKAIATVDADGVSLAAIQALAKRTRELEAQLAALASELAQLRAQN